ncbi:MAG: hypothetical protein RL662_1286 [Bacteroidota bacterium]|jgi:hypothetical protein
MKTRLSIFLLITLSCLTVQGQTPAFPRAEGAGMYTTGGRGGTVYYVNSLKDTIIGDKNQREGTLRWCLKQKGAKTILFKVAGIINLSSKLEIPSNTTIAGQSAPGDGICIANNTVKIDGENVIIRFLRFRMGDLGGVEDDALSGNKSRNIMIDHCSMSWSTDECSSFYDNENFTMQWCILSESLRASVHRKGSHGYGGIWGGQKASFHHNLLAHHDSRNPRMCGSRYSNSPDLELVDFRNNVIYNWGSNSGYAGEGGSYNFVNNYYKSGAASSNPNRIFSPNADEGANQQATGVWGQFYLKGNYVHNDKKTSKNNSLGFQPNPKSKQKNELLSSTPFNAAYVATDKAEVAYTRVLSHAGASYKRDNTDQRIVNETRNGLAPLRGSRSAEPKAGLIDSQQDVGGWDTYTFDVNDIPIDSNIDGIPDGWLESHYPNKTANDLNKEGYSYLEVYLNSLVEHIK